MGFAQTLEISTATNPWVAGFDISDFMMPPCTKTEVAEVAATVSRVVLDLGMTDAALNEALYAEEQSLANNSTFLEVLATWQESVEEVEYDGRKVEWPHFNPSDYLPSSSDEQRIEDNIAAIKILRDIQATKRTATEEDRNSLLKYCGWGGLARVFSPDGSVPHKWAAYRDTLQSLTSASEFEQMRGSITTAYYTESSVVSAMWSLARHLGFKGGRIIEPSGGVGHFLAGMPHDIAMRSETTVIELDTVTASILECIFAPLGVQVHASAIEKAKLPTGFYDLVIGNVPFGDFKTLDTSGADYSDWNIHNYFLGKSVDLVRPGGLIVLITSRHSMDSEKDGHRRWLAAHAELLGAIRMPTMAFKGHAGTEAVTDIMVFKRRETANYLATQAWIEVGTASDDMIKPGQEAYDVRYGNRVNREPRINGYYVSHPRNVIGFLEWESCQYGKVLNPVFNGTAEELGDAIKRRVEDMPKDAYVANDHAVLKPPCAILARQELDTYMAPGSFVYKDGRIWMSEGDTLVDCDSLYSGTARKRMIGMVAVKAAAIDVIEFQAKSSDDVELAVRQRVLNGTYDAFVAENGPLSASANGRLMRSDPDWPVMLALEIWDDESGIAIKADIFTKRTVGHRQVPEKVDNVKDAMLLSLALYGNIVLKDISLRTGFTVTKVVNEFAAQGIAFRDQTLAKWVPHDEYLSGHIRDKIAAAKAAGPNYERNVAALEAVLPKDLGPMDVEARMGAPWIPPDVIETFARELVEDKDSQISVSYESGTASWSVNTTGYGNKEYVGSRSLQTGKWGTNKRCALDLLEGALNQQPPTVTMRVDDRQVVDRVATINARDKWQAIKDHFRTWVYQDAVRRDRLLRIYNDLFNQVVERKYDGAHLTLPGMALNVTPYAHQKNGIWRIVTSGNTLLAHVVGAGKSLLMIAASMELRRLGKAAKPVHVVMNSCLEQYAAEFVRLYPQARVLIARKEDLHGDQRRTFCARICTGDWDAVVMTQSTFERLAMAPDIQMDFVMQMKAEARAQLALAEDAGAKRSLKEIEKRMKSFEARIERLMADSKKDQDCVWFNELGLDYCFLDEAHAYKNLARISKMPRMPGLSNSASQRSFDVLMKTRYFMDLHGGREEGVVMATATPISNSLCEMHVMQVYLQPNTLKKFGVYEFDAWSASFGESVTGIELSPDGSGYRMNTRYARFCNLPELMSIFKGIADVKTKAMLKLPTPKIKGGKPQTMVAVPSEELLEIVQSLVVRAERIRAGAVRPEEDNMLKVTGDGRKAALDTRLFSPSTPFNPTGKLAIAAENMYRIWTETASTRATQLVFSDLGTPNSTGFNVYSEVKRLLMEKGVPEREIEFIHDHQTDKAKDKLFKRVREGSVRFMFGSTSMMGTGTNVQKLLYAIHQLDSPWRPSDVEQRDGRGDRQGNLNETIELWRYVTEKSFDAYSWNLLDVKARFIEQIMTADGGLRSVEDISMSALTYAEIKAIASGNPLVMEKATVDAEVQKYAMKRSQWEDERWRLSHDEAQLVARLKWIDANMCDLEKDAACASKVGAGCEFVPLSGYATTAVASTSTAANAIGTAFRLHSNNGSLDRHGVLIGTVEGFKIFGFKNFLTSGLRIEGQSGFELAVERPNMNDTAGVGREVFNTLATFTKVPSLLRAEYRKKTNELATTRALMANEFEHAEKLGQLLTRQREIETELDLDKSTEGAEVTQEAE